MNNQDNKLKEQTGGLNAIEDGELDDDALLDVAGGLSLNSKISVVPNTQKDDKKKQSGSRKDNNSFVC